MSEMNNQFLDWDSTIENESGFTLLPAGEYTATVTGFTRGEFSPRNPNSKIPACKCAELTISIIDPESGEQVDLDDRLFLLKKFEWKLCQFFTSIGQRKHGEQLRMNWGSVMGAKCRVKVSVNEYDRRDGNGKGKNNRIEEYLDPVESVPATSGWAPGKF